MEHPHDSHHLRRSCLPAFFIFCRGSTPSSRGHRGTSRLQYPVAVRGRYDVTSGRADRQGDGRVRIGTENLQAANSASHCNQATHSTAAARKTRLARSCKDRGASCWLSSRCLLCLWHCRAASRQCPRRTLAGQSMVCFSTYDSSASYGRGSPTSCHSAGISGLR